ncbi:MAG TPA: urate hydroxylase PuuD [Paracoccus sp. (in: a-proteobacteria)]|uniref:urate hydroxylase PuuD n=1 Tax=uncultured Paracoccus sp. TaxID=189685 RepID=UPI002609F551|nr:urate hydroxylase PuuD [uncultured Paracoccus sp.]HMQ40325.1 urate hydroxylase PuuD [Paracoccus sp. (in: a-proteobacteria)]HMR34894.1 urate hydroxylase PuuD [Paracoccus sp. (in: a-proteobacteria)]
MYEFAIIWDWIGFAVRWVHVITAIAWIGSSFYFIALDLGLRKAPHLPPGAYGEEWQVHGGGFYHIQKYLVAPENMPEHLIWFKWESYSTWLSGAALLMIVYWVGGELFLIDPAKAELALWQGILISAASLSIGWLVYDRLCKSPLGERPTTLMLLLFALLVAMGYGYNQIFTGRATMLHLGAFTATIMTANVFFIIMPNQRVVVKDLQEGRKPDPKYGRIAKLRSTHNNYLTLPVIFLMLSNHYPLAFATQYNWLIAALIFLMGVTIRHFFNTMHSGGGMKWWTWAATAMLFIGVMWLSTAPLWQSDYDESEARVLSPAQQKFADAAGFDEVMNIVPGRCAMCHAREPGYEGIHRAPKGLLLETPDDVTRAAREVYLQAGLTHAMPPANVSFMEAPERQAIVDWYRAATGLAPRRLAEN